METSTGIAQMQVSAEAETLLLANQKRFEMFAANKALKKLLRTAALSNVPASAEYRRARIAHRDYFNFLTANKIDYRHSLQQ